MSHNPTVTRDEWIDRLRVPPVGFNALRNAPEKIEAWTVATDTRG